MKQIKPIILSLILLCLGFSAQAQLTAGFTASHLAGCAPLVDTFLNTTEPSTGTTYVWNLDNGTSLLTLTNVSGTYLTPGTYTVTLTATNGSSTSTHSQVITVYPNPTVSFTAAPLVVCPGNPVIFTSTTTGGVPGPVTTLWAFGDGLSGSGSPVSHSYAASGIYTVTLYATNADGCSATLTKPGYVDVVVPPVASFVASPSHFCNPPGIVTFTSTSTGTAPMTYSWTFGDGSPGGSGATPTHTYTATGSYTVTLKVTDAAGCTDSTVMPDAIVISNIHAAFTDPDTACVNSLVNFPNTSSYHIGSTWHYGDGISGGSDAGAHVYTAPGTYNVTLVVFDGYCYDSVTHPIVILPPPSATFTITPAEPCPAPVTATFNGTITGSGGGGTPTITWLYGDGSTGSGNPATHTYLNNGIDTVKMIITSAFGCVDTTTQYYTIYDLVFKIHHPIDTTGCVPLTVNFSTDILTSVPGPGYTPYPYPISTFSWTFGDGSPGSTSPTPSHTYTAVGTYNVTVTIITANGCPATATTTIIVGAPPAVTFTATPTVACYNNNEIHFLATIITGPVGAYKWQFGDTTGVEYTTVDSVTHHYPYPGIFSVTLTPIYNGCAGAPVVFNFITIDSSMAIIGDSVLCTPAKRVMFTDFSYGDNTHIWMFGDGTTSTVSNPTHDYPLPVVYTCTLTTYNSLTGCRDTATRTIDLTRPVVTFSTPDSNVCSGAIVLFTSSVTGGVASNYFWHSSGHSADSTSATYLDTFSFRGIYTIELIIEDQNGCYDTSTRLNYLHVGRPVVSFTAVPASGCVPLAVTFTDASTDIAGTTFPGHVWVFGDGGSLPSGNPVVHTYTTAGSFTITETVTDNIGCAGTASLALVSAYKPIASFTASNLNPCLGSAVIFTNTSSSTTTCSWTFGDGSTSTAVSPTHTYADTGLYTVSLTVTDIHGCSNTATYPAYIHVNHPHASFYMDDSISICPPLTVHFYNTSTGATFYNWKLGDGSISTLLNPTDLYIAESYDTIRLIVSNLYGCTDTAYGHVNILGYAGAFSYTPDSGCVPLNVFFTADLANVPSITWDFADGTTLTTSMSDTITHLYLVPGKYVPKLVLSNLTGCENSSVGLDTIKVDAVYPGFKTVPDPVCLYDNVTFTDTSRSYWSHITNWNWTFSGTTSTLQAPVTSYTAVGIYPVTMQITDGWGCTGVANENVTVYPPPVITVSPDTVICLGDAATLYGYGGVSYTWAGAGTMSCTACNPTLVSPAVVTQYTVTGKDIHGCTSTDTTTVFLKTLTVAQAWGDTQICYGIPVPLFDTGGTKYTWIPGTGLSNSMSWDPIATPPSTTTYMAIAQLAGCLPDTNYVTVVVFPLPTVTTGPEQDILAGTSAQLTATGTLIHKYIWKPANSLNCDSCYNPVSTPSVNTTYSVTVTTIHGCTASDSVRILLYCDNSQLFIPNSFTPNGDGKNDVFYPRGSGVSTIKSFRIYNRWGNLLFERTNISLNDESNAWDGTFNGGAPKPDVYVWVIDAICETGQSLFLKGDVTIIR